MKLVERKNLFQFIKKRKRERERGCRYNCHCIGIGSIEGLTKIKSRWGPRDLLEERWNLGGDCDRWGIFAVNVLSGNYNASLTFTIFKSLLPKTTSWKAPNASWLITNSKDPAVNCISHFFFTFFYFQLFKF